MSQLGDVVDASASRPEFGQKLIIVELIGSAGRDRLLPPASSP